MNREIERKGRAMKICRIRRKRGRVGGRRRVTGRKDGQREDAGQEKRRKVVKAYATCYEAARQHPKQIRYHIKFLRSEERL